MTAVIRASFKEYSVDAFSQAAKNGQIKPGHAVEFITATKKSLTLPFDKFYATIKIVRTSYIDTRLYESSINKGFTIYAFNMEPLEAFCFEHIKVDVSEIESIKLFRKSFARLRSEIMVYHLSGLISKDLYQIIKAYLPLTDDAPEGYTIEECLANKRESEASARQLWRYNGQMDDGNGISNSSSMELS